MHRIPENIFSATLTNLKTGNKIKMEVKSDSYCHFVPDKQRVHLDAMKYALDWTGTIGAMIEIRPSMLIYSMRKVPR